MGAAAEGCSEVVLSQLPVWELQAHVLGSRGIQLRGANAGMLSSSFAIAGASLPSTSVLRIACRNRNYVLHYYSKLSQEGLALYSVVFSLSQFYVTMKREGNNGSSTHQKNQVSQTPCKIHQTKEMCKVFCISFAVSYRQTVYEYVAALFLPFVFCITYANNTKCNPLVVL